MYRVPSTSTSWASSAPWVLVIAVIVIVITLRPAPSTVGSCLLLLTGAGKAYRSFAR
ncbi:hypothetical protein [Streptomyces sp. NPDC048590]|uniref:hypothetical protein n=1 Tax=Streptomyces sp. NPDC048590 TaxID=3365574 RepID=UPI0037243597